MMIKEVFREIDMIKIAKPWFGNKIMTVKTKVSVAPLLFLYLLTVKTIAIYDMQVSVYHALC